MFGEIKPLEPSDADTTWGAVLLLGMAALLVFNAENAAKSASEARGGDLSEDQLRRDASGFRRWGYVLAAVALLSILKNLVPALLDILRG